MKPMLASDYDPAKVRFPCIWQPKIDGVRALNLTGALTTRQLKPHANRHVTSMFSDGPFRGFDGEMAAAQWNHPDLCMLTTSALSTVEGSPYVQWWIFDYVTEKTSGLPYIDRLMYAQEAIVNAKHHPAGAHLSLVPWVLVRDMDELEQRDTEALEQGFEGSIIRDPNGLYKHGRSTVREGGLLRIKRFIDFEIVVTRIIEGQHNANEATINELGLTARSTHQGNMIPNGMVGALEGELIKDVLGFDEKVLFRAGRLVRVGAGRMTAAERKACFDNPKLAIGRLAKCQLFPKGIKDKPRFPTFQTWRSTTDI